MRYKLGKFHLQKNSVGKGLFKRVHSGFKKEGSAMEMKLQERCESQAR